MQSFTGKEIYLPKKEFVEGCITEDGIITNISEERCNIGAAEYFHFPIQREICLCEIRKVEKKEQVTRREEIKMDDISSVINPARIMNERFNRQDIDDYKGIKTPTVETGKTWKEYRKEAKSRKKLKKTIEEV